jgi:hypothetical protein
MGPYTLPVLTFRWRGEFEANTAYAELDVFTVSSDNAAVDQATVRLGIFMVLVGGSWSVFEPDQIDPATGQPAFQQLFGSVDTKLATLSDVSITGLVDGQFLQYFNAAGKWENVSVGDMAFQFSNHVAIVGGTITGMPAPSAPTDVANKAYVDALPAGMTAPDMTLMANMSGVTAPAIPVYLSDFLDYALRATTRGTLLFRGGPGWQALSPGSAGLFLQTQGPGADLLWNRGASGVTYIAPGVGIDTGGAPITTTGTIALAAIPTGDLLANTSGGSAAPVPTSLTLLFDAVFGATQGAVVYRSATGWLVLAPGISGQILTTGGASANPSWQNAPITGSSIPNLRIVSNISGSAAVPTGNTLSNILDAIISSNRGALLFRSNSQWQALAPGAAGQVLQTGGVAGDPSWTTNGGANIVITAPHAQDILSYNPSSGKFENVRPRYVIGAYVPGRMAAASQNLLYHRFSKAVTLPANLGAYLGHTSEAGGAVAATASTTVTLARALAGTPTTFAAVASVAIGAGSVNGVFSTQAAISFAQGDILRAQGPATPDATFGDFHCTLVGFET